MEAEKKLTGNETLKLSVGDVGDESSWVSSEDVGLEEIEDCVIDGLVQSVEASGACIADGEANKATFDFVVELDTGYNNRGQAFSYRFDANKVLADGYEITAF